MSYDVSVGLHSGRPASASEIFASADFDMYREKASKIDAELAPRALISLAR